MERRRRATAMMLVACASIPIGALLFVALRWTFTTWNAWQFSLRPELENWTVPSLGTEIPALAWASIFTLASLVVAFALVQRRTSSAP